MLLGGTVAGTLKDPRRVGISVEASHFKAVTAPSPCLTPREDIEAYLAAAKRQNVPIAESVSGKTRLTLIRNRQPKPWTSPRDSSPWRMKPGSPCCVNIVGTSSPISWDAADPSNFTPETYERIISSIREIIDAVNPVRAYYCIEPMPWMIPDSPDVYLQLLQDVDRKMFGAHMDFVNMINCPRRYLDPETFIEECFCTNWPLTSRAPT